jgi:hypothetical protein
MSYPSSIQSSRPLSRRVRYGPLATPKDHFQRHVKRMVSDFLTALAELLSCLALIAIIWWMATSGGASAVLDFIPVNVPETTSIRQVEPLSQQPQAPPLIFFHAPVARSHRLSMSFESAVHSESRSAGFSAPSHLPSHDRSTPTKTSAKPLRPTTLVVISIPTPSLASGNHLLQSTALALLPVQTSAPEFPVQWRFVPKWPLAPPMSTAVAAILLPVPFRAKSKSSRASPQQLKSTDVAVILTPARHPLHAPLPMQFHLQLMLNLAQSVHDPLTAVAVVPPGTCPLQSQYRYTFPSPKLLELMCLVTYGLLGWSLMWRWYQRQPHVHETNDNFNDNFNDNNGSDGSDAGLMSTQPPSTTSRARRPRHRPTLPAAPLRRSSRLLAQQAAIPRRSDRIAALRRVAPRR